MKTFMKWWRQWAAWRVVWGWGAEDRRDRIAVFVAWHLIPHRLVYWCAIRLVAYATTDGRDSNPALECDVPDVTALDALKAWEFAS